jgi:hypothetical protein
MFDERKRVMMCHAMVMQEHRQHQMSMGHTPMHFGHMMNCLKTFEDGCTKRKCNS